MHMNGIERSQFRRFFSLVTISRLHIEHLSAAIVAHWSYSFSVLFSFFFSFLWWLKLVHSNVEHWLVFHGSCLDPNGLHDWLVEYFKTVSKITYNSLMELINFTWNNNGYINSNIQSIKMRKSIFPTWRQFLRLV